MAILLDISSFFEVYLSHFPTRFLHLLKFFIVFIVFVIIFMHIFDNLRNSYECFTTFCIYSNFCIGIRIKVNKC